jgi:ATP/maltotriose-dependent transcriptional regulator MalT
MAEACISECRREDGVRPVGSQALLVQLETSIPFLSPLGLLDGAANAGAPAEPRRSSGESVPDTLRRCRTRQNLTGASLPQIRRGLARAWRLMLASRIDDALGAVGQIELQLDDMSPVVASRFRAATKLLRAAGLAFKDDSLADLAIAVPNLWESATNDDGHAASTLCRFRFWRRGKFHFFHALPRHQPRTRWSRSRAISAMLDLSMEAAVALGHLRMSAARRLASDALNIAETTLKKTGGLSALPACLAAQLFYEEGRLDQAETMLRDRLPLINAEGPIEAALRAYLVLARIARQRMQYDFAGILLREAEALGERRGWRRLVAACLAERASLLLEGGRTREARLSFEHLDRYAETHCARSGYCEAEILRYRTLTQWRVSRAEAPSGEAVAAFRQLYHRSLEEQDFYAGCGLAVELAEMLAAIGESEEADALFFHTIKTGAAAGLYQVFLAGGAGLGLLLRRAYSRAEAPGSMDREVLPFVGSLLSQWQARQAAGRSEQPGSRISGTLTARERHILAMISQGFSNKRAARILDISPETVKSHLKRVFAKLAVSTRSEAVSRAGSLGLLGDQEFQRPPTGW